MPAAHAVEVARKEMSRRTNLHIVAVAGPGEPLVNAATFDVMSELVNNGPEVHFCLSTNGVLLADRVNELVELGIESLSVSMSTSEPVTAARIYEWADLCGTRVTGIEMGKRIVGMQLAGIRRATHAGIHVKINSVLIPEVNKEDIAALAEKVALAGAELQNVIPLVPCGSMTEYRRPTCEELEQARGEAGKHVKQFLSCHQCRADVVGIPGADVVISSD
jgi:nitrogen fixation protein NifB